jgi:hypothetical protein
MSVWQQIFGGVVEDEPEGTRRFKPYRKGDRVRYPDDTFSGCTVKDVNRRQLQDPRNEAISKSNPIKSVTLAIPYLPKAYNEDVPPGEIENPNKRAPDVRTESTDFEPFWCAPWNRPRRLLAFGWIIVNALVIAYVVTSNIVMVEITKDNECTFPSHFNKKNKYDPECADQYYVVYAIIWSLVMVLSAMVGGTIIFRRSGAKPTNRQRRAEERAPTMQQEYELRMARVHKYQMLVGFFLGVVLFLSFDFLTLFAIYTHFSGEKMAMKEGADDLMALISLFLAVTYFLFAMCLWRYRYDLVQDDANSVQADIENADQHARLRFKDFKAKESAAKGEDMRTYGRKGMYCSEEYNTPQAQAL